MAKKKATAPSKLQGNFAEAEALKEAGNIFFKARTFRAYVLRGLPFSDDATEPLLIY